MNPIYSPSIPYLGLVQGPFTFGRMVRLQGYVLPNAQRFAVNLQCGPSINPRDDLALHVGVDFSTGAVMLNSLQNQMWGASNQHSSVGIFVAGQQFEILILADAGQYKIAVDGKHFAEMPFRLPAERVTHLTVDGDITVKQIQYEGSGAPPAYSAQAPVTGIPPYSPGMPGSVPPYPPEGGIPQLPSYQPPVGTGASAYMPPGSAAPSPYAPPPMMNASGPQPNAAYGYPQQPSAYNAAYPTHSGSSYPASQSQGVLGSVMGMASKYLGTGGSHNAYPAYPTSSSSKGNKGMMGMVAPLAGAAVAGVALSKVGLGPKKLLKKQKKAMKYGIPLAGAGLGGMALTHALGKKHKHHKFHRRSSSSSSSSSD